MRYFQPPLGSNIYKRRKNLINNFANLNHDVVFEILKNDLDSFSKMLKDLAKDSDLLIVDHYSVSPLIQNIKSIPIIYNSHNAELDLGMQVHPDNKDLLQIVEQMEGRILKQSKEITYC